MTPAISVIICTHNPRVDYLIRVLAALRGQTVPADQWELLVVDNASKDPVAPRFDLSWHPNARHVREDELGLTPARLRGIAESKSDLIIFVDDDNVLDPDYLEQAERIGRDYPFLGAWGGQAIGEFESPPPPWMAKYRESIAVYDVSTAIWANLPWPQNSTVPAGAGMCVRRCVAKAYSEACCEHRMRRNLDRAGHSLVSGGDTDLALTACDSGMGTGRFPQLRLKHIIPTARISIEYIESLIEGQHYSRVLLQYYRYRTIVPRRSLKHRIVSLIRMIFTSYPDRLFYRAGIRGAKVAIREIAEGQHG